MTAALAGLNPFRTAEARRLALLFGVVYFAQGMWYLPNQTIIIVLKDAGLSAGQVATFFLITTVPWLIKPLYGLVSDFVPLFGRRRKSYFLLTTALAAAAGATLAVMPAHPYRGLAAMFTLMGLGLAFTDVLTDALMVESGRPRGLTGAFQAVQWAAISIATVLVGVLGGYLAETRNLHGTFAIATAFPLLSLGMAAHFIREPRMAARPGAFRETWVHIQDALRQRDVWVVAGFILFWTFSPSFGPALVFYQTDVLKFSQQFIGALGSLNAVAAIAGALVYAPLSRRVRLRSIIVASIALGVAATLAYLLYRDARSAIVIETLFGFVGMITQLAILDLAAKACPPRVEATFFALLMSVFNFGAQGSQIAGGYLYDWFGYTPLVLISAGMTALAWPLVPLVRIERIEVAARADADTSAGDVPAPLGP